MINNNTQQTVLFEEHQKLNAKIVNFAGWQMPVQYSSILNEHNAVRNACGIFDVSHMGEIFIRGKNCVDFLQYLTINDVSKLAVGQSQYTAMLNEKAGFVDDLFLYKLKENEFLACVNAANTQKDFNWIQEHAKKFNVSISNESNSWSQLAVQGPNSPKVMKCLFNNEQLENFKKLMFTNLMLTSIDGHIIIIARTGYTGEIGYEIFIPNDIASNIWNRLLENSLQTKLIPCGLGARDILRLESCYLLYGNDMNETITPLEAGISWAIAFNAKNFIGKDILIQQKVKGIQRKLVAFEMEDKAIARHEMQILYNEKIVGYVSSGSFLPVINKGGGLALINAKYSEVGMHLEVDIRNKRKKCVIVKKPFYKAKCKDKIII